MHFKAFDSVLHLPCIIQFSLTLLYLFTFTKILINSKVLQYNLFKHAVVMI